MSFFAAGAKVVGGLILNKAVNKVASGSSSGSVGKLPGSTLDINKVIEDARTAAAENYKTSLALERANNPSQAAFRDAATAAATAAAQKPVGATAYAPSARTSSLLDESADSILNELRLGSALPTEVQNQVVRSALSKSSQAGLAGSFAGRGLVAQDVGTTGLALANQRRQNALNAGNILEQIGLNRAQFGLQQETAGASTAGALKGLADSYALPTSGLDPGSIASLYVGQSNVANQTAQNQFLIDQMNANKRNEQINQLLGFGASALGAKYPGIIYD